MWHEIETKARSCPELSAILSACLQGTQFDLRKMTPMQLRDIGFVDEHMGCHAACTAAPDSMYSSHILALQMGERILGSFSVIWLPSPGRSTP